LKWWQKNLGSYIEPHIEVFTKDKQVESGQDSSIVNDDHGPFFLQLLSSAHSLYIDFHFNSDLDVWLKSREDCTVFKNPEEIYVGPMSVVGLCEGWKRNHGVYAIPIRILNLKYLRAINFTSWRDRYYLMEPRFGYRISAVVEYSHPKFK